MMLCGPVRGKLPPGLFRLGVIIPFFQKNVQSLPSKITLSSVCTPTVNLRRKLLFFVFALVILQKICYTLSVSWVTLHSERFPMYFPLCEVAIMRPVFSPIPIILVLCLLLGLCGCSSGGRAAPESQSVASTGTMPAQDINTLSVGAVIVARDSADEEEIYDFVSTVFEHRSELSEMHPLGAMLDLTYAASVTGVPYHPGAARYFAEKGCTVNTKEGVSADAAADLNMGTGNNAGNYYTFGSAIAELVNGSRQFAVTPVPSGGSKANIEALAAGDTQLCFVQSDIMSYAYNGERLFQEPIRNFSVVAALYTEQLQIVTNDSSITSVDQLRGKKVSIGVTGSGVYYNALDVLSAYGMSEQDIEPCYQAFGDSAQSLQDGTIDAAFIVAGVPTPAIASLVGQSEISMVAMDQEHIQSMIASNPFYSQSTIAAGSY